jgi:hypothetical protein
MDQPSFDALVRAMCAELPAEWFDGITEVVVSPRAVPHPAREGIFTLGECIPLPLETGEVEAIQSRVVLYHGSFRALAELDAEFDWRAEAWETLTHELRHHLEWRAREGSLEAFDRAAEHDYARQEGQPFDPLFHLDGEAVAPGLYRIDENWFFDRLVRDRPAEVEVEWHGTPHHVPIPPDATLPAYLTVEGLVPAPAGEVVLVLRRRPRLRELFRPPPPWHGTVAARRLAESPGAGEIPPVPRSEES